MMRSMTLSELEMPLRAHLMGTDTEFSAVSTDSRHIEGGALFVALVGERFDAHEFLADVERAGLADIGRFLKARFARIYPIYFLTVLVSFLIYTFIDPNFTYDMSLGQFVRHVFALGTISVFWSIPPEIQFYVVFLGIWSLISLVKYD